MNFCACSPVRVSLCSFPLGTLKAIDASDASKLAMDRLVALVALATYVCDSQGLVVLGSGHTDRHGSLFCGCCPAPHKPQNASEALNLGHGETTARSFFILLVRYPCSCRCEVASHSTRRLSDDSLDAGLFGCIRRWRVLET